MSSNLVMPTYLDLLDQQRESALTAVADLSPDQIWQRPAPKEWCIGEILHHNYLLIARTMPYVKLMWRLFHGRGQRRRQRPYQTSIADPYDESFPMWVGFMWKPSYTPQRPLPLADLAALLRDLHSDVRQFYADKPEDILGNVFVYDPYFGWLNLIVTLHIGLHHDELHYRDIKKMAAQFKSEKEGV